MTNSLGRIIAVPQGLVQFNKPQITNPQFSATGKMCSTEKRAVIYKYATVETKSMGKVIAAFLTVLHG